MGDNIIIICGYNYLKERPDKLVYYFFNYLQQNSKYSIQIIEPDEEKLDKIINENSILILFTCYFNISNYKNNKIIYWIEDMNCTCNYGCYGLSKNCKFYREYYDISDKNYYKIWFKYLTPITKRLMNEKPNYYLKFPHMMFDPNIHKDYQLEKNMIFYFMGRPINQYIHLEIDYIIFYLKTQINLIYYFYHIQKNILIK